MLIIELSYLAGEDLTCRQNIKENNVNFETFRSLSEKLASYISQSYIESFVKISNKKWFIKRNIWKYSQQV